MRFVLVLLILVGTLGRAAAEPVFVRAGEAVGHGWLFGSPRAGGQCWIALPEHVAGSEKSFVYFADGIGGEAGPAIAVEDVPGAVAAAGGTSDLAFAPVAGEGRSGTGRCLSRLGPPSSAWGAMMRSARDDLVVNSFVETHFRPIQLRIEGAGIQRPIEIENIAAVDGASTTRVKAKGLVNLSAADPEDAERYFLKGLSGSVVQVKASIGSGPASLEPFAMVLQVPKVKSYVIALRFDFIRSAFELVEAYEITHAARPVAFQVAGFDGMVLAPVVGPSSLDDPDTCWRLAPRGGERSVSLYLALEAGNAARDLTVEQAPGCGEAPLPFVVEQRARPSDNWSVHRDCETVATLPEQAGCALDLRGPRQIRVRISGRSVIGLSRLRLR
ncbi:hypothetical protein L1787_23695 [Acuticoccus sp. M5D2P5]|uniref:hypothetical protein n=1 Tax=Acuticoccus kalidii TaxID=2910977 RepID=UPI001F393315|nr:hypothetical protein [Acuticoccus kalidii]MCF3936401.1 hypothetical protein [Acuticoccus kalidii]